jgi:hypothetical protein
MKLMGFFRRDELYKSSREGHFPFLLEFVKNDEIVVFKDLGSRSLAEVQIKLKLIESF